MSTVEVAQETLQQVYDRLGLVGEQVNSVKELEPSNPLASKSSSPRTNHSISVIHASPVETDDNIVFELV